jgi:hypothetical protein
MASGRRARSPRSLLEPCTLPPRAPHAYACRAAMLAGWTGPRARRAHTRVLPTQTLPMESISRRLYHKKLYSPMQIF